MGVPPHKATTTTDQVNGTLLQLFRFPKAQVCNAGKMLPSPTVRLCRHCKKGIIVIDGITFQHPGRFSVVGTVCSTSHEVTIAARHTLSRRGDWCRWRVAPQWHKMQPRSRLSGSPNSGFEWAMVFGTLVIGSGSRRFVRVNNTGSSRIQSSAGLHWVLFLEMIQK